MKVPEPSSVLILHFIFKVIEVVNVFNILVIDKFNLVFTLRTKLLRQRTEIFVAVYERLLCYDAGNLVAFAVRDVPPYGF